MSNIPVLVPVFRRLMGYESANGGNGNSSGGRSSGNNPRQSATPDRQFGGKRHTIELGELSTHSTKSVERSEFDSTLKTEVWTDTQGGNEVKYDTNSDIEAAADGTYRHPFSQSESVIQVHPPLPSNVPRRAPSIPSQAPGIVVHQHVFVNSDT